MKKIFVPNTSGVTREMIYEDIQESHALLEGIEVGIVEDVVLPFTKKQMPDDLCQQYVDETYGTRDEFEDEGDFVDFKIDRADKLRKRIITRLKKSKKKR